MNEEVVLTEIEDVDIPSDVTDGEGGDVCRKEDTEVELSEGEGESEGSVLGGGSREEYERLIRTDFKEYFSEDTQRLINKRFKKYKALEDKVKRLEEEAKRYADIESLIASERERAVLETEERMKVYFKSMRGRATENALIGRTAALSFDVSQLTKSERASLASRAQKGEKIHF